MQVTAGWPMSWHLWQWWFQQRYQWPFSFTTWFAPSEEEEEEDNGVSTSPSPPSEYFPPLLVRWTMASTWISVMNYLPAHHPLWKRMWLKRWRWCWYAVTIRSRYALWGRSSCWNWYWWLSTSATITTSMVGIMMRTRWLRQQQLLWLQWTCWRAWGPQHPSCPYWYIR